MNNFEKWILKKKNIWINILLFLFTYGVYFIIWLIIRIKNNDYYDMLKDPEGYANKNSLRCIHSKVVGVTFNNDDGTSRQKNIANIKENDELKLIPYEYNPGEEALGVFHNNKQIGNVNADLCYEIIDKVRDNEIIIVIANPTGGNKKTYGCNFTIIMK